MTEINSKDLKFAQRRVRNLKHFYHHLAVYGVINLFLHILNWMTSDHYWAMWPLFGWGIAIALHSIRVLDFLPYFDQDWEDKKVQEILAKRSSRLTPTSD